MGQYEKKIKRFILKVIGFRYTDTEWEEVYNKAKESNWTYNDILNDKHLELSANFNASLSSKNGLLESKTVDTSYFKKISIESYLMKNMTGLKFEQCFNHSKKRVSITILSKLESGTLDQKILNDPEAEGFLYFLNLPKIATKPMYISIPEIALKLLSKEWVETTGKIDVFL